MTITLSPEQERAVQEAAARKGITPQQWIDERLREPSDTEEDNAQVALRARVKAARGSLAHLGPSTLIQDKAEERAREERRWQRQDKETSAQ